MSVFKEIIKKVEEKPVFLQEALFLLLTKNILEEEDILKITQTCKIEGGIIEEPLPVINFKPIKKDLSLLSADKKTTLTKIKNVKNIKALKEGEELSFNSTGVTAIYGDNGSGKSSYSGILKHTCKTRGVLPLLGKNFYKPENSNLPQKAEIEYLINDFEPGILKWEHDNGSSGLKTIDVFDSTSASHYIEKKDEVAFLPSGFFILEKLGDACQRVEQKIRDEISSLNSEEFDFSFLLNTGTEVSNFLETISHLTTTEELQEYSGLSEDEENHLQGLLGEVDRLRKIDPKKNISENKRKIERFEILKRQYKTIEPSFSDNYIQKIVQLINKKNKLTKLVNEITEKTFSNLPVEGIGNIDWRQLWESAKKFVGGINYHNCPLCLQPIDEQAKKRFMNFEGFIEQDIQNELNMAKNNVLKAENFYKNLNINFSSIMTTIKELSEHINDFEELHNEFNETATKNKESLLSFIDGEEEMFATKNLKVISIRVEEVITELKKKNEVLETQVVDAEIKELKKQIDELEAKKNLKEYELKIIQEISRRNTKHLLNECIPSCNTRPLTTLSNQISKKYVTTKLKDNFKEELEELGLNYLRVSSATKGDRGKQCFYLKPAAKSSYKLNEILSEGEHRAIALASFLADLSLSEHYSTVIFDDPVDSLDDKWKERIAKRIAREGQRRQVIVFTHDLNFSLMLQEQAREVSASFTFKSLEKKGEETGIVVENPEEIIKIDKNEDPKITITTSQNETAKKLFNCPRCQKYYLLPDTKKSVSCFCLEDDPVKCDPVEITEETEGAIK